MTLNRVAFGNAFFAWKPTMRGVNYLPKTAIAGDGYCLPVKQQNDGSYRWVVGSSFDEGEDDLEIRKSSDNFNREQAKGLVNYSQGDINALQKSGAFVGLTPPGQLQR